MNMLVTDTACLCLIPVCSFFSDMHQRGPILRPIIVYIRWYSEHTLSQLLTQHSCTGFLFAYLFRRPGVSLMHI